MAAKSTLRLLWVPIVISILTSLVAWLIWTVGYPPSASPDSPAPPLVATPGLPWFVDVTKAAGIDFVHFDSATPMHYLQETMGSGLAWIDYDGDGWPDLFCVQDGPVKPNASSALPTHRLYRNNGDGTFRDVSEAVGLDRSGYGMGGAVADFDNDGFDDLLVTYFGGIALYHNQAGDAGGRRFADVTAHAGLDNPHWATSAAWGDVDNDGFLDLYVCNYCEVDLANYPDCKDAASGQKMSCPPWYFPSTPHRLYRNNGNGTFTDFTVPSGIGAARAAPGLAVAMIDLDGDGRLDIYVANDMKPAYLFHNQGGGKFVEKAVASGCAYGPGDVVVAGMAVAVGDVDGSGWPSLFVTNFEGKPSVLHRNRGAMSFQEASWPSGLAGPSIPWLKFGAEFLDADLDGRLDLAVANGHIHRHAGKVLGKPYAQPAQLFVGSGDGNFREVSNDSGAYFREARVGRGVAVADFDNDGKPDLAFSNTGGPIGLLHNRTPTENNWLRLELLGDGVKSNRNAVGARVAIEAGGVRQVRWVFGGGSYLSASERRLFVGLGTIQRAERLSVVWPSGRRQEFRDLAAGKGYRLTEGMDGAESR